MVDWWDDNGPPVYIAVASYLGLIKKKSSKGRPAKHGHKGGDLNELAEMFKSSGGMIRMQ